MSPKSVGIVGFNGVMASHLTGAADVFASAALDDGFGGRIPCYRVWIIGLAGKPFTAESGLIFHPGKKLTDAPSLDTIVVAGGSGARAVSETLAEWILSRACETRRIASIGNGLHALIATGLLDGREVTTDWRSASDLQRRHPTLRIDHKRRLVKDGVFYTSAGLTAGVDLALSMVEEDYGGQVGLAVRRDLMLYLAAPSIPIYNRGQPNEHTFANDRFGDLIAWVMRNLDRNLTVDALARQAGMCPAHFTRAFKSVFGSTPGKFVENLRLNEARRRLSSRGNTLRSVAASVGFRDTTAFRRAFASRFGTGPADYATGKKSIPVNSSPNTSGAARPVLRPSFG